MLHIAKVSRAIFLGATLQEELLTAQIFFDLCTAPVYNRKLRLVNMTDEDD